MLKAKMKAGGLIFGLSKENINRLQQGQPIVFNLKEMGLEDRSITIVFGETEETIYESLIEYVDLNKTKINF